MSTPTCQTGLLNLKNLANAKPEFRVYICEGEWDTMALDWLLNKTVKRKEFIVVGTPGATIFKKEWAYFFRNRTCYVMYDNDEAGENGEHAILKTLTGTAKYFKFIHWLEKFPTGFDVRDMIKLEAIKNNRPMRCHMVFIKMMKDFPRKQFAANISNKVIEKPKPPVNFEMTWEKFYAILNRWFKIDNCDHYLVANAVLNSNFGAGDPIWMFIVASPGEGKSELLASFKYCEEAFITSALTPNSLISGFNTGGEEVSLLPQLNDKTLIVKDAAAIQNMRESDREALFGLLRDAYDGSAGKVFGTGKKHFESKFSMLWGITPSVYQLDLQFSALGERFLKCFVGNFLLHKNQIGIIEQAMDNVGQELNMREEIAVAMYSLVEIIKKKMKDENYKLPVISEVTQKRIAYLAAWIARMKGVVSRDRFYRNEMLSKAYAEVGTRQGKQLKRLLMCFITVILRGYEIEPEYNIIKKVGLDTISAKREDIFRAIYLRCSTINDTIDITQISNDTKYSSSTILRALDDLVALQIVDCITVKKPFRYTISKLMREYTQKAELYTDDITKNRPSRSE